MRVSNNMLTYGFLDSLNKSLDKQNKLQEQLSDGKQIHRPSDDPIKAIRSLRFSSSQVVNEQYIKNAKDASSWMQTTDSAMSNIGEIIKKAKELLIKATTPNPSVTYQTTAESIDGLIDEAVSIGNTKLGDRYVFAGQKDKTQPFVKGSVSGAEAVIYHGDSNKISIPIHPGSVDVNEDSINITGDEVFGPAVAVNGQSTMSVFSDLIKIKNDLLKPSPDMTELSKDLSLLDTDHNNILTVQTKLGTRASMYEMAQNMLTSDNEVITSDLASNEDIDISKAIIDFKNSENVYRTALSVGAKILPVSLADFLK